MSTNPQENISTVRIISREGFAPPANGQSWTEGVRTTGITTGTLFDTTPVDTKNNTRSGITSEKHFSYRLMSPGLKNPVDKSTLEYSGGLALDNPTAMSDPIVHRQMMNEDIENIQNSEMFPFRVGRIIGGNQVAKYDYRIRVGDSRYPNMVTLEDKLMQARSAFGIPVHGNQDIARAMKYYMYNRFKVPDTNMAHNKSVTYVFFTRPDCNLLDPVTKQANQQTAFHTEASMVWRRNPDLLKLLTDHSRCDDPDNFNLLLSNQVTSFDISDENLAVKKVGKTWAGYEMNYGHQYEGRQAGEFSCNFTETNDYSIINLIKLWITYIDNVARGVWMPSYNLLGRRGPGVRNWQINDSHVFTKTLDYAASAYVFKCAADGETVLYWSKYYGIFPTNTGAGALQWDIKTPPGDTPNLNIKFAYAFKRDLSPISLIEFNHAANVNSTNAIFESSFNPEYGHSNKPFVGSPFIELNLNDPQGFPNRGGTTLNRSHIRLKFRPVSSDRKLTDAVMYKARL